MPQQYNPYSVDFHPNDRFEIKYQDKLIVAEGRQREAAMIRSTVDLLNAAYTFGVNDVTGTLTPLLESAQADNKVLEERISQLSSDLATAVNRYYTLVHQMNEAQAAPVTSLFDVNDNVVNDNIVGDEPAIEIIDTDVSEIIDQYVDALATPTPASKKKPQKKKTK